MKILLTSGPVWASLVAKFSYGFGYYVSVDIAKLRTIFLIVSLFYFYFTNRLLQLKYQTI